jgi:hypothetical protein
MKKSAEYWIKNLNLSKHPEGGYFKEVYKSTETIPQSALPNRYNGDRYFATSIYYLIKSDQISKLHQLKSDETWVFIDGSPINLHLFKINNEYKRLVLGRDMEDNQIPQFTVPKFTHFGASLKNKDDYSLVACIVAPGFDFSDFKFSDRDVLLKQFPEQKTIIENFT